MIFFGFSVYVVIYLKPKNFNIFDNRFGHFFLLLTDIGSIVLKIDSTNGIIPQKRGFLGKSNLHSFLRKGNIWETTVSACFTP